MAFKVSNLTNGIVEFDGVFWQPAQTRELKTVTEEMLEAAASNFLLIIEVTDSSDEEIPKGYLGITPVTSPHVLSNANAGHVLLFNEETSAIIYVPDGITPGLEAGCRNKNIAQITIAPFPDSGMNVIGAGTVTNDSSKVSTFYVEDETTVVTSGDFA
ncbi:MAG: hypothetical protein WC967_09170 [Balneolaceae bacterium]